jgi:sugar phosphate permease
MRVTANWVPVIRRGNAIGIIGTGYQVTLGLTYFIAGQSADLFGWRAALYVPAALLALAGLFMLVCLRERPAEESPAPGEPADKAAAGQLDCAPQKPADAPRLSFVDGLYWTLYNPTLWLLGLSLGLLNACRYGFLDWGVTHLMETQDVRVGKAGLQFVVIAVGATAGSYLAGWATDRFFGSRRAPVICVLMLALCGLTLVYDAVVRHSVVGTMLLLVVIGFCIYGPQVLLVGTAPVDMAHRGAAAAAAGFVNFLGYMGAATGDVVTGYYSADEHGGWKTAIYIWAGWAFAGAVITAMLWNTTARKLGLISGVVPKLAAVALLLGAGTAVTFGGQPLELRVATYAAAALAIGSVFVRWAALPALLVAVGGLVFVFATYVYAGEITWSQTAALATYGLAIIAALMILVERKDEPCE